MTKKQEPGSAKQDSSASTPVEGRENSQVAPETGYIYVTDYREQDSAQTADDSSLSHQLLFNGSEVEKRGLREVIEDHNYHRALEREQKREEKEQQREAEIVAGIAAMRAERARAAERDRLGLPPEDEVEEQQTKKPLLIGGLALAGLLLAGGGLVFALGGKSKTPVPTTVVPSSSASPTASPAASASLSAPAPSFYSKQPEVSYVEPTETAITPGTIEYVTEEPSPVDELPTEEPSEEPTVEETTVEPSAEPEPTDEEVAPEPPVTTEVPSPQGSLAPSDHSAPVETPAAD